MIDDLAPRHSQWYLVPSLFSPRKGPVRKANRSATTRRVSKIRISTTSTSLAIADEYINPTAESAGSPVSQSRASCVEGIVSLLEEENTNTSAPPLLTNEENTYIVNCMSNPEAIDPMEFPRRFVGHADFVKVIAEDITRVLDLSDGGWLNGIAIDAFMSYFIYREDTEIAYAGDANWDHRFPAKSLYIPCKLSGDLVHGLDHALKQKRWQSDKFKEQIAASNMIYIPFNQNSHFIVLVVDRSARSVITYNGYSGMDSAQTHAMAQQVLRFLACSQNEPVYNTYMVNAGRAPTQTDAKSCGVLTCMLMYLLMHQQPIPDTQGYVAAWRAFIAAKIRMLYYEFAVREIEFEWSDVDGIM